MCQLYIWITANYVAWQELPRAQDFGYKMVEDKYLSKLHSWLVTNEQHQNYLITLCFCKANKCTAACSGDSFCTLETMPNIVSEYDSEI